MSWGGKSKYAHSPRFRVWLTWHRDQDVTESSVTWELSWQAWVSTCAHLRFAQPHGLHPQPCQPRFAGAPDPAGAAKAKPARKQAGRARAQPPSGAPPARLLPIRAARAAPDAASASTPPPAGAPPAGSRMSPHLCRAPLQDASGVSERVRRTCYSSPLTRQSRPTRHLAYTPEPLTVQASSAA